MRKYLEINIVQIIVGEKSSAHAKVQRNEELITVEISRREMRSMIFI